MWFQLPDPDELLEDLEETVAQEEEAIEESQDIQDVIADSFDNPQEEEDDQDDDDYYKDTAEDIPDAVKPRNEDQKPSVPGANQEPVNKAKYIAIAAGIVILAIAPIFALKNPLMKIWPQSIALYNAFGMVDTSASQGLIFDQIRAEIDGDKLNIFGQVINLTAKNTILPVIEIAIRDKKGEVIKNWHVELPQTTLEAEGVLPFQSDMMLKEEMKAAKLKDIETRFVLTK